jgi:putative DNA primase/helicase
MSFQHSDDFVRQFARAIEAAGFESPAEINPDGRLHRFATNGKVNDDAGWYVLHGDGVPWGAFGCWRSGFQSTWSSKRDGDLTPIERQRQNERIKRCQRQRDMEQARIREMSSSRAAERLLKSHPVIAHPYLAAKAVQPSGITAEGDLLLVPVHDTDWKVHSLQTIDPAGKKRFMRGGKIGGNYFCIGMPKTLVIVCEGYATGLTIHDCTGHAVAVAFCSANLVAVAQGLHRKYRGIQIIVAADDDWSTQGNPGRACANLAALAVGGRVALPIFPAGRPDNATDFNDLYRIAGKEAVVACFAEILGG